jgi:hypothetical protein
LCKLSFTEIINSIQRIQSSDLPNCNCPYGDGYAAEKIIKILRDEPIIPLRVKMKTGKAELTKALEYGL